MHIVVRSVRHMLEYDALCQRLDGLLNLFFRMLGYEGGDGTFPEGSEIGRQVVEPYYAACAGMSFQIGDYEVDSGVEYDDVLHFRKLLEKGVQGIVCGGRV